MSEKKLYDYNGVMNINAEELFLLIVIDETGKHFGVDDVCAIVAVLAGIPFLSTPQKPAGTVRGTSLASKYAAKYLPFRSPLRLPTLVGSSPTQLKLRMTTNLGRFIGRTLPVIGWVILASDVCWIMYHSMVKYNFLARKEDRINL